MVSLRMFIRDLAISGSCLNVCCRFGYDNSDYYTYVIDNYAAAGIPLETFVADSQYMDRQMIFTLGANFSQADMSVRARSRPRSLSQKSCHEDLSELALHMCQQWQLAALHGSGIHFAFSATA